ncbi:UspA domain protein [Natronomonas moolapensis 8.8.11]|uniref:UspA domain protein n=1 Tax=Natronomonas moolapensis (strain DSM 18674 / CECT 7526 / JCM 14361 / 8.8.11) TaxID=268739 RepID=M1XSL0_NATM8|nr:universal stress protein [Natronomonas moolapensis]CCQ37368.1 UspA domain protein [Natronomonas moolapensis 8.8.11]
MFDSILVPTDGSEAIARVIDTASELAETHDAALRFVYVVPTAAFERLPLETPWESVDAMLREEAEAALVAAEERAAVDRTDSDVREGPPGREIPAHAEETDSDLIVMGTHSRLDSDRELLGTVTGRVVRSAEVPVMAVRVGESEPLDPPEERCITADPSVTEALE